MLALLSSCGLCWTLALFRNNVAVPPSDNQLTLMLSRWRMKDTEDKVDVCNQSRCSSLLSLCLFVCPAMNQPYSRDSNAIGLWNRTDSHCCYIGYCCRPWLLPPCCVWRGGGGEEHPFLPHTLFRRFPPSPTPWRPPSPPTPSLQTCVCITRRRRPFTHILCIHPTHHITLKAPGCSSQPLRCATSLALLSSASSSTPDSRIA